MLARVRAGFGQVGVQVDDRGRVVAVSLIPGGEGESVPRGFPSKVVDAFRAYLAGEVDRPRVPVGRIEGTVFQQQVWAGLVEIEPGETVTYGAFARRIGRDGAARAVGQALAANPLPLVWPCHRVTARDGLGGFGGCSQASGEEQVEIKRWLLEHEASLSTTA